MILKAIYEDCTRRRENLSCPIACINYQKTFDGLPRSWVKKSKEMVAAKRTCQILQVIEGEMEDNTKLKAKQD